MAKVIEFQNKDEKQLKQNVEIAVGHTVDAYIDKGQIDTIYREDLKKEIFSKVQGFARQFLSNSAFPMPYHPTGDDDMDGKSEAVATQAGVALGQVFLTMFVHSLSKVVDLEVQLWIKEKALNDVYDMHQD